MVVTQVSVHGKLWYCMLWLQVVSSVTLFSFWTKTRWLLAMIINVKLTQTWSFISWTEEIFYEEFLPFILQAPKDYDILAIPLTSAAIRMLRMRKGMPEEWQQYLARPSSEPWHIFQVEVVHSHAQYIWFF